MKEQEVKIVVDSTGTLFAVTEDGEWHPICTGGSILNPDLAYIQVKEDKE